MFEILGGVIAPALLELLQPQHLFFMMVGVVFGLGVGLLPGLGGISGMAILLPFIYGMNPTSAMAMVIGMIAVNNITDTFPSVLMGIPGGSASQATVLDGYPLSKKGQAARALSAAFSASMIGGVFGAMLLTVAVFFARPILLTIGFGEQLLLVVLALVLVGMLTGPSIIKGLAACGLGLLVGTVGSATATAEYRMTFGSLYLTDGIPLVLVALGIFALPEIIDVLRTRERIAEGKSALGKGWLQGIKDTWIHRWIVLRCSGLGAIIGALPGIGGSVIDWLAYGHVLQSSKDKSQFGKGDVRGVVGIEAATNSKDGGALIPTLLFGIPGSGTMAMVLAAFVLIGIQPGRQMVEGNLSLTFVIIWSLALANIAGTAISFILAAPISRLTTVRFTLLAPFLIVIMTFAAYQANADWGDLIGVMLLCVVGVLMKRFGWSRPAFLIGFVLSPGLEAAFYRTAQIYGFDFLTRPAALILIAIVSVVGFIAWRTKTRVSEQVGVMSAENPSRLPQSIFCALLLAVPVVVALDVHDLRFLGQVFPMSVAALTFVLVLASLIFIQTAPSGSGILYDAEAIVGRNVQNGRTLVFCLGSIGSLLVLSGLIGFYLAAPIFVFAFLSWISGTRHLTAGVGAAGIAAALWVFGRLLNLEYAQGLLQDVMGRGWPLGM